MLLEENKGDGINTKHFFITTGLFNAQGMFCAPQTLQSILGTL